MKDLEEVDAPATAPILETDDVLLMELEEVPAFDVALIQSGCGFDT